MKYTRNGEYGEGGDEQGQWRTKEASVELGRVPTGEIADVVQIRPEQIWDNRSYFNIGKKYEMCQRREWLLHCFQDLLRPLQISSFSLI